ncbi:MAG: GIY-YIG nuclease family protein [Bacteroidales bacterium]|nr:GIY-YIG nuclease family protein [Bacteroidales bacterium]
MYYTYIIYSSSHTIFYKGITDNPERRLFEHNNNLSRFTADKGPWEMVYLKEWATKREALIEEKRIKRLNVRSLELLIRNYKGN